MDAPSLTPSRFLEGFVARLVLDGVHTLWPQRPEEQRGFAAVHRAIASEAEGIDIDALGDWERDLIHLQAEFAPSNVHSYDQLVYRLTELQTSVLNNPNHHYRDLPLNVSPPYAEWLLGRYQERERRLIESAAEGFRRATGR